MSADQKREGSGPNPGWYALDPKDDNGTQLAVSPGRTDLLPQVDPGSIRSRWAGMSRVDVSDIWLRDALVSGQISDDNLADATRSRNTTSEDLAGWLGEGGSLEDVVDYELDQCTRLGADLAGVKNPRAPENYDGEVVDIVAEHDGWEREDWDTYTRSRGARDREDAVAAALRTANESAGIDLTGTAASVRNQASDAYLRSETILALASAKEVAEGILTEYPDAVYLVLDESDQGSGGYCGGDIVDISGDLLADFDDEFGDDFDVNLTDLPTEEPLVDPPAGSRLGLQPDPRFAFLTYGGRAQHGGDARLDLTTAAAINLRAI